MVRCHLTLNRVHLERGASGVFVKQSGQHPQIESDGRARHIERAIHHQIVRQGAGRAGAGFLPRQALAAQRFLGDDVLLLGAQWLADLRIRLLFGLQDGADPRALIEEGRHCRRLLAVGTEDRGQVAHDRAPPRGDVVFAHLFAEAPPHEVLKETKRRGVVEHLRIDPPATRPRRRDDHRHAVAETDAAGAITGGDLQRTVHARRAGTRPWIVRIWCTEGQVVVKETVVFVVGQHEDGLAPTCRIRRQDVQHFRHVPRTKPRRIRVIAEIARRHQPRHRR